LNRRSKNGCGDFSARRGPSTPGFYRLGQFEDSRQISGESLLNSTKENRT